MKKNTVGITVLAVLLQACCVWTISRLEEEQKILQRILNPEVYNPSIRASDKNMSGPVTVRVNMYIRSIDSLDDMNRELSLQVTFRHHWKDARLEYYQNPDVRYLTVNNPNKLWTPDTFFSNEKSGHFHNIVKPNVLLRIYPEGDVIFSTRLSLKLSCPMDLKYYPMDSQTCSIIFASYGYITEDVEYLWKSDDPVQITRNLNIPRFELKRFFTDYCTSKTTTGEYSCLRVNLLFRRNFRYYFFEIYLLSIILVFISWICFWLSERATAARVFIWMAAFLTISLKLTCFSSQLPDDECLTAYNTWTTTCIFFLVAVIFEIGVVAFFVSREDEKNASEIGSKENDFAKKLDSSEDVPHLHSNAAVRVFQRMLRRYPSTEQKIDAFCRILFPLSFALFNVFYWCFVTHNYD